MPQLIPFYFLHLLTFGISIIIIILAISSYYILPHILKIKLARTIISKL